MKTLTINVLKFTDFLVNRCEFCELAAKFTCAFTTGIVNLNMLTINLFKYKFTCFYLYNQKYK